MNNGKAGLLPMIGIRVDVNQTVATGHIMRDIAVAIKLKDMGADFVFISADDNCKKYLDKYGFEAVVLDSKWNDLDSEADKLIDIIRHNNITSLLVDSYYVTENYMRKLSEVTKVTYFDEMFLLGYGCSQMINGVLEPPDYSMAKGKAFLGPEYVSLRDEFSKLPPKHIRESVEKILITSGGTDNYHFCKLFLEHFLSLEELDNVKVIVVVGGLCVDAEWLKENYADNERVELYINTNRMAELFSDADYAVTAGGTTLYEVCAVGVAASCFALADNQLDIVESFDRKGLISYAGDLRVDFNSVINNIVKHISKASSPEYRRMQAEKLQSIVDGRGAQRIAEILM